MGKLDAFATIRRARSLSARHPDVPTSVVAVALNLATYGDGRTGSSIRPGHKRVAEQTRLHENTVRLAIRWLEQHGELRCDKPGHRGSAACYTFLGVAGNTPASDGGNGNTPASEWNTPASDAPTNQTSQPSGPPGPRAGEAPHPLDGEMECSLCGAQARLADGLCPTCLAAWQSGDAEAIERMTR